MLCEALAVLEADEDELVVKPAVVKVLEGFEVDKSETTELVALELEGEELLA